MRSSAGSVKNWMKMYSRVTIRQSSTAAAEATERKKYLRDGQGRSRAQGQPTAAQEAGNPGPQPETQASSRLPSPVPRASLQLSGAAAGLRPS